MGGRKGRWWIRMNDEAFTQLVRDHTRLIFTVCYRLVHDYQEAENLTQDTFLTAYRAIGRFEGDHYKPWLVRIAVNKSKDYLKSAGHALTDPAEPETLDAYPAASSFVQDTERRETVDLVRDACEKLPEPYREVALMRFMEDKSYEEIAAVLGRPLKTVQTQGLRAREKLRRTLKEVL